MYNRSPQTNFVIQRAQAEIGQTRAVLDNRFIIQRDFCPRTTARNENIVFNLSTYSSFYNSTKVDFQNGRIIVC